MTGRARKSPEGVLCLQPRAASICLVLTVCPGQLGHRALGAITGSQILRPPEELMHVLNAREVPGTLLGSSCLFTHSIPAPAI